jgi:hypothetical protein
MPDLRAGSTRDCVFVEKVLDRGLAEIGQGVSPRPKVVSQWHVIDGHDDIFMTAVRPISQVWTIAAVQRRCHTTEISNR